MATRARIFEAPALDTADFAPRTETEERPNAHEIDQIAGSKFRGREVVSPSPAVDHPSSVNRPTAKRLPMVYRTGRNVTFSAKTTQATVDAFYELAQKMGWKAGETFEKAVEALQDRVAKRP
jgi:hypothetical protein